MYVQGPSESAFHFDKEKMKSELLDFILKS